MFLGEAEFEFCAGKDVVEEFVVIGVIFAAENDEGLASDFGASDDAVAGQRMFGRHSQANGIAGEFLEAQAAQHGAGGTDHDGDVQFAAGEAGDHFLGGEIVEADADVGHLGLKSAQGGRKDADGRSGSVADLKFAGTIGGDGAGFVNGFGGAFEDLASFDEKDAAGVGEADGFGGAFEEEETEFVFEVADLAAQGGLGDVEFEGGARNVFGFSNGNEITEVAEFHPRAA
jgi:hypothetical protein